MILQKLLREGRVKRKNWIGILGGVVMRRMENRIDILIAILPGALMVILGMMTIVDMTGV
jgi:hypothetical protein